MLQPICKTCRVAMERTKTGIVVYQIQGSRITMLAFADIYSCPHCKIEIISDSSKPVYDGDPTFPTQDQIRQTLSRRVNLELRS